jgi:hypothetical protein
MVCSIVEDFTAHSDVELARRCREWGEYGDGAEHEGEVVSGA